MMKCAEGVRRMIIPVLMIGCTSGYAAMAAEPDLVELNTKDLDAKKAEAPVETCEYANVHELSPDLIPGAKMQAWNLNSTIKIRPKKHGEIKDDSVRESEAMARIALDGRTFQTGKGDLGRARPDDASSADPAGSSLFEPARYVGNTIATVMDGFQAADFDVRFSGDKRFDCRTFQRGDKKLLLAAWIPGGPANGTAPSGSDVTLPGVRAKRAWVIHVFNGTVQELNIKIREGSTAIQGLLIQDYPVFVMLALADAPIPLTLASRLELDPHWPRYHYSPFDGQFIADVHPFYWKGDYHVFYQYEPTTDWSLRNWGHARSRDLVHWEELPIALARGPEKYDAQWLASGDVIADNDGRVRAIYSAYAVPPPVSPSIAHATADDDDLIRWTKDADSPYSFPIGWDAPDVWKDGAQYYMTLCTLVAEDKQAAAGAPRYHSEFTRFVSPDLRTWKSAGLFFTTEKYCHALDYSHFFRVDGKEVFCTAMEGAYQHLMHVGHTDPRGVFQSERLSRYDGNFRGLSASGKTLTDDQGRCIFLSWIQEDRSYVTVENMKVGWQGVLSLPRVVHVAEDNSVLMEPVPELVSLRGQHSTAGPQTLISEPTSPEAVKVVEGIRGDCLEIIAQFRPQGAKRFGLLVLGSSDGGEATRIEVDVAQKKLRIDTTKSCSDSRLQCQGREVLESDFAAAGDSEVEIRVFVDRSIIEVFANRNRAYLTARAYPIGPDSQGVAVWAAQGCVECASLDAWKLQALR